jgi:hypothetical protein
MRVAQFLVLGRSNNNDGGGKGAAGQNKARLSISHIRKVVDETSGLQQYFKGRKELSRSQLRVNIQGEAKSPRHDDSDESD